MISLIKNSMVYRRYARKHPKRIAEKLFYKNFGRKIDWDNPKDLNEKVNCLKFHVDHKEWARVVDKYLVREYVKNKGLEEILIPLLGYWYTLGEAVEGINKLNGEFVLKSNNGCGHIEVIDSKYKSGDEIVTKGLKKELRSWLAEKDYGIIYAELHYQYINNCIIAEKRLHDPVNDKAKSLIDYKIWCFGGEPYGCLVVYDRDFKKHKYKLDYYDLEWNQYSEYLNNAGKQKVLDKPQNWEKMVSIARTLSKGHPEVRVDLYNICGKVYFGEMTFTSYGGYMPYFTQEHLLTMGHLVPIKGAFFGH